MGIRFQIVVVSLYYYQFIIIKHSELGNILEVSTKVVHKALHGFFIGYAVKQNITECQLGTVSIVSLTNG
jgi:hypothetical protein